MNDLASIGKLPAHIAVIMDGNGRWAQKQGAARIFGHKNAIKAVRETTEGCAELGVKCLTLYAFSTENWGRPKQEIKGLMTLLVATINEEVPTLMENNIRLHSIGDISRLPEKAHDRLQAAKEKTGKNDGLDLILALNYSGKWDITNAMNRIAAEIRTGDFLNETIKAEDIDSRLSTYGFPDPELLIRTSGEMRISNFLLWQLAYAEMYFTPVLWPDFRKEHLHEAIRSFQQRERRFGKLGEQVKL